MLPLQCLNGKGTEWFWEPGEHEKVTAQEREKKHKSSVRLGPPNRSIQPAHGKPTSRDLEKINI
jgi:hypothetical protein